jgi:predicted nucleic acid-binding protein
MSIDPLGFAPTGGGQAGAGTAAGTLVPESSTRPQPPCVIDTSVAAKWYIPEEHSTEARLFMGPGIDRHAPDLLPIEAGHALLKRVRSAAPDRHLPSDQARRIVATLRDSAPIQYHSSLGLLEPAFALAEQIGASVYDGLFLALSIRLDGLLVTADRKFFDKIAASPHAGRARWVADPP